MEKKEPSYLVGGNVNWCSHYGEQYGGGSLKNGKQDYPGGPVVKNPPASADSILGLEDSTRHGATKPMHHNYRSLQAPELVPQDKESRCNEKPTCHNKEQAHLPLIEKAQVQQCFHKNKQTNQFKKLKQSYRVILQSHSWGIDPKKTIIQRIHAPQCSFQQYLQSPRHRSILNAY